MDMVVSKFSILHPANIVRYDLCSCIWGHKVIVFQDRKKFTTTI